jgi:hypothetical protein
MKKAIATLNRLFPNINAVSTVEWDGEEGGIWFRQEGNLHTDGMPFFEYYSDEQVHPEVNKALKSLGLYAEPYDAGTWMAYEA